MKYTVLIMLIPALVAISCQSETPYNAESLSTQAVSGQEVSTIDIAQNDQADKGNEYTYQPGKEETIDRIIGGESTVVQWPDMDPLVPERQVFKINNLKDTIISTRGGNEFFIPSQCFADSRGKPVEGRIVFSVREYSDYAELISQKYSTTSGRKILESGGMFYLEARKGKEKLQLRPFKELVLQSAEEYDEDMFIYYGKRNSMGIMTWKIDSLSKQPYPAIIAVEGKLAALTRDYYEENFVFNKKRMLELDGDTLAYSVSFGKRGYVIGNKVCEDRKNQSLDAACGVFLHISDGLSNKYPGKIENNWETSFSFVVMSYDSYKAYRDDQRRRQQEYLEELKQKEAEKDMAYTFSEVFRQDKRVENFYNRRPSFFLGGLGPINIDKEIPGPDRPSLCFTLKDPGPKKNYVLLLKNGRTILYPGMTDAETYRCENLPTNREIVLLSFFSQKGKIYWADKTFKSGKSRNDTMNLAPLVNYEELDGLEGLKTKLQEFSKKQKSVSPSSLSATLQN